MLDFRFGSNSEVRVRNREVRFALKNGLGQPGPSGPKSADIAAKVFLGVERKFLEPLMRFMRGNVRDHIVSSKIDHEPPQWR